jgi:hypothetical protein
MHARPAGRLFRGAMDRKKRSNLHQGHKMDWELVVHKEEKYLEITSHGVADYDGSIKMAKFINETMRHNRITKVLIDHSNITGVSGKTIEIYERPKILGLLGLILGVKIAEIINPEHMEHFRFLETVCKNQGFNLLLFRDRKEALDWLLGR